MSLGVHFALNPQTEARLLTAAGDDAVIEIVEQIEEAEAGPDGAVCQTDKAWDAIHRCLTDGTLLFESGHFPLNAAILGGRQLVEEAEYTVSYVSAQQVAMVAEALAEVGEDWLRGRYDALAGTDYDGPLGDEDFVYTWENLQDVREFFAEAARAGKAVIFTVDA